MESGDIIQLLETLAKRARMEEMIFRAAVTDANGLSLTAYSVSCATLCARRAAELDGIATLYRAANKPRYSFSAQALRAWIWLRNCFSARSDRQIIDECGRHVDASRRACLRALHVDLPVTLRTSLTNHLATIDDSLRGLAQMRNHSWKRDYMGKPPGNQSTLGPQ